VAGAGGNWRNVYAVEVCMELVGDEIIDLPKNGQGPDSRYTDCSGRSALFNGRLHMVFRNTFQLRSQGMFATPAVAAAAS
jgi:type IV pilus assembly protein PilW